MENMYNCKSYDAKKSYFMLDKKIRKK